MAGTGSVHCRRETAVSPNMQLAGGEWTSCKGGKMIRVEVVLHGLEGRRGRDYQEGAKEGERCEAKVSSITSMAV